VSCKNCARALRHQRAKAADHPGTVRDYGRGLCATCYRKDDGKFVPPSARARNKAAAERRRAVRTVEEKQALDEALTYLHEPPGGCGWHVIRCRHCRWIAKYRTRQQQQIAGFLHARSHVNEILLKEYT